MNYKKQEYSYHLPRHRLLAEPQKSIAIIPLLHLSPSVELVHPLF